MCLSKAYLDQDGHRELLLEEVASVIASGETLRLKTLFGEEREVGARIREIDFLAHSIILEDGSDSYLATARKGER